MFSMLRLFSAGIANALGSIGKTHSLLLKSNEVIVRHLLSLEDERKKLNYSKIGQLSQAPARNSTDKSAEETAASVSA